MVNSDTGYGNICLFGNQSLLFRLTVFGGKRKERKTCYPPADSCLP